MLTKDDLQQIGKVVDERLKPVEQSLRTEIRAVDQSLGRVEQSLRAEIHELDKKIDVRANQVVGQITDFIRDEILPAVEHHQAKLEQWVERVEEELGLHRS